MKNRSFTKEEAQRIFAAAAEQQQTYRSKDEERLTLTDLEQAAEAAGIDASFIRAAAADLLRPDRAPLHRTFLGIPVELRRTAVLERPLDDQDWARIVADLRQIFATTGMASDVGEVREWTSGMDRRQMPTRVMVEPERGGARMTIERKSWPRALGFTLGAAVNVAMGLVLLLNWLLGSGDTAQPALILISFGVLFGGIGQLVLRHEASRLEGRFDEALHRVRELTREAPRAEGSPNAGARSTAAGLEAAMPRITLEEEPEEVREATRQGGRERS